MAKEKVSVRTSMFSRSVRMFSIRAPPVTALIALCKPVAMADNWLSKREDGHAGH